MFIQVFQGPCTKQDEVRNHLNGWRDANEASATGWLGGTFGFTDDNQLLGVVRFESRAAAEANSGRPEQDAWAETLTGLMDGPLEFHDSDDVTLMFDGGSDDAGFVQIIRGKVDDPARLKALLSQTDMLHEMRPDILGATLAFEPDGTFTETIAFSSEAAARAGEQTPPPEDVQRELQWAMNGATFYDLHSPWFESA